MSVIISPVITNAGLSVFTPLATGIEFTFTHVAVGTGTSAASSADTALEHEIARFPIAGGGMVTGGHAVSINAIITNHQNANPQNYAISEFGFYGVDGANNTILFAIHRQSTAIVSKVSGADISAPFVMGLAALPVNNMTVQIDTNASAMLALLGQHTASNHPHTQYKRTLDNTERLKIATAVDADEAIRKDELDALRLRLIANGVDTDLGTTNLISNLDSFVAVGEGFYANTTTGTKPSIYGVAKTWRVNSAFIHQLAQTTDGKLAGRYSDNSGSTWTTWRVTANELGDSTKLFLVANGTTGNEAVNKSQLDTKAPTAGNSGQEFAVAAATTGDSAVNKTQLDALRVRLIANGVDADLAITNTIVVDVDTLGNTQKGWIHNTAPNRPFDYCVFEVTALNQNDSIQVAKNAGQEAYRYGIGGVNHTGHTWSDWTYRAMRNGDSNQFFYVKTATDNDHAPTYKQLVDGLNGVSGNIPSITGKADLAGNSTQLFSAADGTTGKEVVNFDQLNAMLNRVWPIGSVYENSISNLNPADPSLLGFGTWVATQAGRVSVGYQAGDSLFGAVGNEGGARGHKMTAGNLIQHDHDRNADGLEESVNVESSGTVAGNYSPGANYLKLYTKTGKTGLADPDPIPTLPPYHVSYKWIRTA